MRGEIQKRLQMTCNSLKSKTLYINWLGSGQLLLHLGPHYLRGKVWVSSRETGHNPDVTSSYETQGPSLLQDISVKEMRQIHCPDLYSVWQRYQQQRDMKVNTYTASSLEQYSSITGLWILLRAMCDFEFGSPSIASSVTTLCRSQRTKL